MFLFGDSPSILSRYPSGMLLFAPAVSVPTCVGDTFCQITNEILTHDTSRYQRGISPPTPLLRLNFAAKLLYSASMSWSPVPSNIPVLVWAAGDSEDRYINTLQVKSWVTEQKGKGHRQLFAIQCERARHELDNEAERFGGPFVRKVSADFVRRVVIQKQDQFNSLGSSNCQRF